MVDRKVAFIAGFVVILVAAALAIGLSFATGELRAKPDESNTVPSTGPGGDPTGVSTSGPPSGQPTGPGGDPTGVPTDQPSTMPSYFPSSAPSGPGVTPLVVGNSTMVSIGLDDFIDEGGSTVRSKYTYTFEKPGASYLAIHFANFDFSRECSMELYDQSGLLVAEYTDQGRRNMGDFWARHVEGEVLNLVVFCVLGAGENRVNFEIDEVVTGFSDSELDALLNDNSIRPSPGDSTTRYLRAEDLFPVQQREMTQCGTDDTKNAICFVDSNPALYEMSKAIARLKIAGKGTCTGWLVGPNNLLMTNNHCIGGNSELVKTDFQFMAEGATCNANKNSVAGYDVYDGIEIVKRNYQKDYTLVRLDGDPASKYGYFEIDNRIAQKGEPIFIPGHPKGRAKQFALTDSHPNSGVTDGNCAVLDVGGDSCGFSTRYKTIQYTCDTLGGSSGSPVVAVNTGKVIGLHHCGAIQNTNCQLGNLAVPFEGPGIFAEIEEFLEAPVPETPSPSTSPPTTSSPTTSPPTLATSMAPSIITGTAPPTVEVTTRCFAPKMRIEIQLDDFAAETRWELWQTDPPRMITGGGGYENNALIQEEHCLADDGLHYLRFYDDFGDGFCCGKGNGYYKIWYQEFPIYHNTGEIGNYTELEISPMQVCLDVPIHLTIQTDRYPVETTWELIDDTGALVGKGGPYTERYVLVEESMCGTSSGDYTLTVKDSFRDGLCCESGNGYIQLTRDNDLKISTRANGQVFEKFITYSIPAFGPAEVVAIG